jgi:hypothetical protein
MFHEMSPSDCYERRLNPDQFLLIGWQLRTGADQPFPSPTTIPVLLEGRELRNQVQKLKKQRALFLEPAASSPTDDEALSIHIAA